MKTPINHTIGTASDRQPNRAAPSKAPRKVVVATSRVSERMRTTVNWMAASVTLLMIVVVLGAPPAMAMKETFEGRYDLRAFVAPGNNPQYSCQPGSVSTRTVKVTNPSNFLKTYAFETFWIYKSNASGVFVLTDHLSMSPHPGGVLLEPGQTVTFESANVNVPPGYYMLQAEVQFYRPQGDGTLNYLGEVNLRPNLLSDYQLWGGASSYVRAGLFTYCYAPAVD